MSQALRPLRWPINAAAAALVGRGTIVGFLFLLKAHPG